MRAFIMAEKKKLNLEDITAATELWMKQGNTLCILVLGEMGVGKSTLVNGLIGEEVAIVGAGPVAVTDAVMKHEKVISGVTVKLYDTPGLFDPDRDDEDILSEIKKYGLVDLVLICIDFRQRIKIAHTTIISYLVRIYGPKIWDNTMFVLTFANVVEQEPEKFKQLISQYSEILQKHLVKKGKISSELSKKVPIEPAGYKEAWLPDRNDWLSYIWMAAFEHTSNVGKPAMLRIVKDRVTKCPDLTIQEPVHRQIQLGRAESVYQYIYNFVTDPKALSAVGGVGGVILALLFGLKG